MNMLLEGELLPDPVAREYRGQNFTFVPKVGTPVLFLTWIDTKARRHFVGRVVGHHPENLRPNIEVQFGGQIFTYNAVEYGDQQGKFRARHWCWLQPSDECHHGEMPPPDPNDVEEVDLEDWENRDREG